MDFFSIVRSIFAAIGAVFTTARVYRSFRKWQENRKELQRKTALLNLAKYFDVHIVHLGGESSTTYSMQTYSNEEGGYYFNPPTDFVNVSFNRAGDSAVVTPTSLTRKFGFVIESVAGPDREFQKVLHPDICHLSLDSLKNEYFVRFIKRRNSIK